MPLDSIETHLPSIVVLAFVERFAPSARIVSREFLLVLSRRLVAAIVRMLGYNRSSHVVTLGRLAAAVCFIPHTR